MRLSKNFTLSEFTRSNTANRKGIPNQPSEEHLHNILDLTANVLQPIRDGLGAIRISSGYRSPRLNRSIGGSKKSQHCKGQAADLQYWKEGRMDNKAMYDWILKSELEFDQLINEFDYSWLHISFKKEGNRNQVLEAYKDKDGDTAYKHAEEFKAL
tara:strand:- start:9504 stop:9971 length:468 start_codon:yes stop_codon:yes gene_type:complete